MTAHTLNTAKANLEKVIQNTIDTQEETMVVTDRGSVVLVEEKQWNEIVETLRLLNDRTSLTALLESIEARKKGNRIAGKSVEDLFGDE
ncbi:MAG: type II toxin-antitoxin system Phd/YefM family antitoxin [Bacteroidota bacterium]